MRAMLHRRWTNRLSDYLDGTLPEAEGARVRAHLARCSGCRAVLDDLREIVSAARGLGPLAPPRDLWPDVERAVHEAARGVQEPGGTRAGAPPARAPGGDDGRAPDVLALPTARARRGEVRWGDRGRRIALTAPQLGAAAAALVVLSVSATRWALPQPAERATGQAQGPLPALELAADLPAPPARLAAELSTLERELTAARAVLDANTLRVLERNMAVIERAIEDSRTALALDPGNEFLSRHLDQVWQRKLDYLRQAAAIVAWTD